MDQMHKSREEKNFPCPHCPKEFKWATNLKRHKELHKYNFLKTREWAGLNGEFKCRLHRTPMDLFNYKRWRKHMTCCHKELPAEEWIKANH